eukprot:TRINITY_DN27340_c0_g1_i5.p1 TRINITY_DN27340_c0_g1~~TRINITY_DN27340_c0_g1_i5.p1  ORF type:complete len:368 (+),score=31.12 TRINITY_DN27340_c0_g1_i5:822-1925(+)
MQAIQRAMSHRFPTYLKPYLIPYNLIYATCQVADITHHLSAMRLSYFARLARAPNTLKALINANYQLANKANHNRSFLHLIAHDLQWLQHYNHQDDIPNYRHTNIHAWYIFANANSKRWKRIIKRTMTNVLDQDPTPYQQDDAHPKSQDHDDDEFLCSICGKSFNCRRDCTTHMSSKHKFRTEAYYFATGTKCKACNRQHHTIERLRQHIRNTKCIHYYRSLSTTEDAPPPLPTPHHLQSRKRPAGKSSTYAAIRYLQHHGPIPQTDNDHQNNNNHNNLNHYNIIDDDNDEHNSKTTITIDDNPTIHTYNDHYNDYIIYDDDSDAEDHYNNDNDLPHPDPYVRTIPHDHHHPDPKSRNHAHDVDDND